MCSDADPVRHMDGQSQGSSICSTNQRSVWVWFNQCACVSRQEFLAFSSGWSAQESCLLWQYTAENLPSSAQFLLFMCRARNTSLFLPVSSQRQFFPILARLFVKGKKSLLVHARCLQRLRGGTERIFLPESDPPYHAGGSAVFWGREKKFLP